MSAELDRLTREMRSLNDYLSRTLAPERRWSRRIRWAMLPLSFVAWLAGDEFLHGVLLALYVFGWESAPWDSALRWYHRRRRARLHRLELADMTERPAPGWRDRKARKDAGL